MEDTQDLNRSVLENAQDLYCHPNGCRSTRYLETLSTTRINSGLGRRTKARLDNKISDTLVALPKSERGLTTAERMKNK